jgi:uncharacterized membrane protein YkgB
MTIQKLDATIMRDVKKSALPMARIALFIVFFWFGALKVMNISPADPLVAALLENTLPVVSFDSFRIFFGIYEMAIGAAFLLPRMERVAIMLLVPHMLSTFLPLIVLADSTWASVLVPTFAGQYIIKNLVIIALALSVATHARPLQKKISISF